MRIVSVLRDNGTNTVFAILAFGAVLIAFGYGVRNTSEIGAIVLWAVGSFLMASSVVGFVLVLLNRDEEPSPSDQTEHHSMVSLSGDAKAYFINSTFGSTESKDLPPPPPIPDPGSWIYQSIIKDRVFRIVDVPREGLILSDRTFEDCVINGPAVLFFLPSDNPSTFSGNHFDAPVDVVLIDLPEQRSGITGVIALKDCHVRNCRFYEVAIIAPPAIANAFRETSTQTTAALG